MNQRETAMPTASAQGGTTLGERLPFLTDIERRKLAGARVGIAGAGGLGSNTAVMLARSGTGRLVVIDGDLVEASNLGRQHYAPQDIGKPKVEALAALLARLAPDVRLTAHRLWLDSGNIPSLLPEADIWVEALDGARTKALFVAAALRAGKPVVCASGMGGVGGYAMARRIMRHSGGLLAVVGDFRSDVADLPPFAPRVMQCSAMQADAVLEWILTGNIKPLL